MIRSRFAKSNEVFTDNFKKINDELIKINKDFNLKDHTEINKKRCAWANKFTSKPMFYSSRLWEYPFAILSAELNPDLKCADIGCGTTPFTVFLTNLVGAENVVGFDNNYITDDSQKRYSHFGIKKSFYEKAGFTFKESSIDKLNAKNEEFDRVFCISVIEHIEDLVILSKGIKEMVRILKPGGRLIITMDLGIEIPLTNPFEIIIKSGLIPLGPINFSWPKKRFINLDGKGMDVFGLVLHKSVKQIEFNITNKTIKEYLAMGKYKSPVISRGARQLSLDYMRNIWKIKLIMKILLNKYENYK